MLDSLKERPIDFRILKDLNFPDVLIRAGETIVSEGDDGTLMYMIRKGTVEVRINGIPVEEISDGGIFGEMALIDDGPRSAAAIASVDTEVAAVDKPMFLELVRRHPEFALSVMRLLAVRLRRMNKSL